MVASVAMQRRKMEAVKDVLTPILSSSIIGIAVGYLAMSNAQVRIDTELFYIKRDLELLVKITEVQQSRGESLARIDMQVKQHEARINALVDLHNERQGQAASKAIPAY